MADVFRGDLAKPVGPGPVEPKFHDGEVGLGVKTLLSVGQHATVDRHPALHSEERRAALFFVRKHDVVRRNDGVGRLRSETVDDDGTLNLVTNYTYDADGNQATTTDPGASKARSRAPKQ